MKGVLRYKEHDDGTWSVQLIGKQHEVLEESPRGTREEAEAYLRNYQVFRAWQPS